MFVFIWNVIIYVNRVGFCYKCKLTCSNLTKHFATENIFTFGQCVKRILLLTSLHPYTFFLFSSLLKSCVRTNNYGLKCIPFYCVMIINVVKWIEMFVISNTMQNLFPNLFLCACKINEISTHHYRLDIWQCWRLYIEWI